MIFRSDAQRRAIFASIFSRSSRFSFPPRDVLSTSPKYVFDERPVDQFSMKSDYQDIIKGLKEVEENPKYAVELREKAKLERERAEKILAKKLISGEELEVPMPKYEEVVTQGDIDSYMRKYGLKSVPDIGLVAEDKAADLARTKGVIHYETAPDSYADHQKYLLEETKKMQREKK